MNALLLAFASPLAHSGIAANYHGLGLGLGLSLPPPPLGGDNTLPLRIMALGASITWGTQSSDSNGYREDLRRLLAADGNPVRMVGSRHHGTMADDAVEAWPGYVIAEVHERANASVPRWKPNVVLVNAGTNDCVLDPRPDPDPGGGDAAAGRMASLLEDLWAASPRALVALSSLLPNADTAIDACLGDLSERYAALAAQMRTAGRRLVFADMRVPEGPRVEDLADGTHPDDAGYAKMAALWHAALVQAGREGMLQAPEDLSGVNDDDGDGGEGA